MPDPTTGSVFHLATPSDWAAAQDSGEVAPPSLALEGFIHCSRPDQLEGTISRHFDGVDELVLLRLDLAAMGDAIVWDEVRAGERYPHVYRPLAVTEVVEAIRWHRGTTALPT